MEFPEVLPLAALPHEEVAGDAIEAFRVERREHLALATPVEASLRNPQAFSLPFFAHIQHD